MLTRREFTRTSLVAGLAVLSGACTRDQKQSDSGTEQSLSIIDAHAHIWPAYGDAAFPFQEGVGPERVNPPAFTAADLIANGLPYGVDRFVLIQHAGYHGYDSSYLLDAVKAHPGTFTVVGQLDENDPQGPARMQAEAGSPIRGYRINTRFREGLDWWSSVGMERMWRACSDSGQAMCLLRWPNLPLNMIAEKCAKYPQARVVMDHYGHVDYTNQQEVDALFRLADRPNFMLKVSKYCGNGKKTPPYFDMLPFLKDCVRVFGSNRLMWGTDSPYQTINGHTYGGSVAVVAQYADFLSQVDRENLLVHTAERFFFKNA